MWRCLNDIFGYCTGEPEKSEPVITNYRYFIKGKWHEEIVTINHCSKDKATCGYYSTLAEFLPIK